MKTAKKLLIICAALVAAAVACICAALFSATLQTKIANSISPELSVERAKISPTSAEIDGLNFGEQISAKKIEIEFSPLALLSRNIKIDSAKIAGLKVSTTRESKNAQAALPAETQKTADAKSANAETKTRAAEKKDATAKKFEFPWTVEIGEFAGDAEIDGMKFEASAKNVELEKNLKPKCGRIAVKTKDAELAATAETKNGARKIAALLSADGKKIVQLSADANADYSALEAEARIDANSKIAAKFAPPSLALPEFEVALYAHAKADAANFSAEIIGDAKASELAKISEALKPLGAVGADVRITAAKNGGAVSVKKFEVNVSESGTPLLGLSATPFEAKSQEELAKAEIEATLAVPARLVNAFANGIELASDDIRGKFAISFANGGAVVKSAAPLSLTRAYIRRGGETVAENLNIFANADAFIGKTSTAKISLEAADSKTDKLGISADAEYANGAAKAKIKIGGSMNAIVAHIRSISSMESLGLKIDGETALAYADGTATLESLAIGISDANGKKAADISTLSKISYDTKNGEVSATSAALAKISAPAFPFSLVKPFAPEIDAAKASLLAEISMPQKNVYAFDAGVSVAALSYKKGGKFLARGLSVSTNAKGSFDGKTARVEIPKCVIGENETPFCTLGAKAEYDTAKSAPSAEIDATVALAPLFNQPALLKYSNISRGTADIRGAYKNGGFSAEIAAHSIATRTAQNVADSVVAKLSGDAENIDAKLSIKSTLGETKASAKLSLGDAISLDADAPSIVVDDIALLAGAFKNPNYTEKQPEAGKSQRVEKPALAAVSESKKADSLAKKDAKAFWNFGKNLTASAKVGKAVFGGKTVLEKLDAKASATESKLEVSKLSLRAFGADFAGAAAVSFDAKREIPYELSATKLSMANIEVSGFFADKNKPPMSGIFDASMELKGSGNNAEHLAKYLTGNAEIKSKSGGTIRILDKNSDAGAAAAIAGNALSIAGQLLGGKVKELGGIGELVSLMTEMKYTEAEIKLSRNDADFNFNFDSVEMKTDSLVFSSKGGRVLFDPTVDFAQQKLDIPVNIYVASSTRGLFQSLGYAKSESPMAGYFKGPEFTVSGTVSKPTNNLINVLTSTNNAVGNALDKLNIFKRK